MATNSPFSSKPAQQTTPSFLRDTFPAIRRASLLFIFCIFVGAALIIATQSLRDHQIAAANQAQQKESRAREQFRLAELEKHEIQHFQPQYLQLAVQGFAGPEQRLNWIEAIQSIQRRAELSPVDYEISEQQRFALDPAIDIGSMELRGSKMMVKMNLLHELELFRFLDALNTGQMVDLQHCTLKRLSSSEPAPGAPRLSAECTLYWITAGQPGDAAPAINAKGP